MLYVDIPTPADIRFLIASRDGPCVSIYLPTTPVTQEAQADRIALKNLTRDVVRELELSGTDNRLTAEIVEQSYDLIDDDEFWRVQAHGLAIFVTPTNMRTFRLPTALVPLSKASDRFLLKPLLRSVSFAQSCYVLALAQKSVRVIEVLPDLPAEIVHIDGLPSNAGRAIQGSGVADHWPSGRIHGREGQKVLLRQFARNVDKSLRPLLSGSDIPLVLAAAEPLASIYRSINSYSHLARTGIEGNPEEITNGELAERARRVLDDIYRGELSDWRELFAVRDSQGRATTDIAQAARAAVAGAIEALVVDIDEIVPGRMNDDGSIVFAEQSSWSNHDLVDEIAKSVIVTGGRVIGVRKSDMPREGSLAAILRYAL